MKKIKYILIAVTGLMFSSCEKNDYVSDTGTIRGTVASVNIKSNKEGTLSVGQTLRLTVAYWMEGENFGKFSLKHAYDSIVSVDIQKVAGTSYSHFKEYSSEEYVEYEQYSKGTDDGIDSHEGNFDQFKRAYVINNRPYYIDKDINIKYYYVDESKSHLNITASDYLTAELHEDICTDLAYSMPKAELKTALVETTYESLDAPIMTEEEFSAVYAVDEEGEETSQYLKEVDENGKITFYGGYVIEAELKNIPKSDLIGDESATVIKRITDVRVQYHITNSADGDLVGKSNTFSFRAK